MKNLWNATDAAQFGSDLLQCVYGSRLLGSDPSLVLHGGGNTSVKVLETNLFGETEQILHVKGRGADLATIEAAGFSPCRLKHLLRLTELSQLSDPQMESELRSSLTHPFAPAPSVETLLHAILPAKFVDHTHADAVLTITNTHDGAQRVREIYGDDLVVIPYVMPGFKLARVCAKEFAKQAGPKTLGMLLLHHGLFTFGETAQSAYERMIELVTRAETYLQKRGAWGTEGERLKGGMAGMPEGRSDGRGEIAALRRAVSNVAGFPVIMSVHGDADALTFANRADIGKVSQHGPATPDHVIRTKHRPLIGRDVEAYAAAYRQYFVEHGNSTLTMIDPAPRVILDRDLGLCVIGKTAQDAAIAEDIYRHTMRIIARATALGGWRALPSKDIFEVEYWDLEQAKLRTGGAPPAFAGEVVYMVRHPEYRQ